MGWEGLRFEWDGKKARSNFRKHGVSFDEASTLFSDPEELILPDPDHSEDEQRSISIGRSSKGRLGASLLHGEGRYD
jgi:uncharacterized DUF497 family protein